MAFSIIPMSFQEPLSKKILDISCSSQLWLLSGGFTTTFSALFCKLWRLNKVIHSAGHFKKITVRIQDVLIPFILLLTLNFSILTFWSFLDPLRWSRVELQAQDTFGRATESVGACMPSIRQYQVLFLSLLGLSNLTALGIANWQSYKARNVVSDLSETTSINISMLFMTEATILGMPVLFLVIDDPSAFFLVKSVMISVLSFGVMLPIFVPKLSQLQMGESRAQSRRHTVYFHSVAFPMPRGIAA
jgi:gamma-aminobutyric acid type B receptor